MIIPKRTVCDICEERVGINNRYYTIKSKDYVTSYVGCISSKMTHHICHNCMDKFQIWLREHYDVKNEEGKE